MAQDEIVRIYTDESFKVSKENGFYSFSLRAYDPNYRGIVWQTLKVPEKAVKDFIQSVVEEIGAG